MSQLKAALLDQGLLRILLQPLQHWPDGKPAAGSITALLPAVWIYAERCLWKSPERVKGQNKGQTKKRSSKPFGFKLLLAAGEGFEPSHTESESAVLPLHNPAILCCPPRCVVQRTKVIIAGTRVLSIGIFQKIEFWQNYFFRFFCLTSRWRTGAAAARTRGAGRCASPTPPP